MPGAGRTRTTMEDVTPASSAGRAQVPTDGSFARADARGVADDHGGSFQPLATRAAQTLLAACPACGPVRDSDHHERTSRSSSRADIEVLPSIPHVDVIALFDTG